MNATSISWTEKTWNPISGCTPISEGCANCYAKRMAQRLRGRCGYPADEPFMVTLHEDKLNEPLRMRKPARVFVASMGDLFHEDVPDEFIDKVFAVMALASRHTFLVLTKRPERMRNYILSRGEELLEIGISEWLAEQIFWPGNLIAAAWPIDRRWRRAPADYDGPDLVSPEDWFWEGEGKPFAWPLPNVWCGVTAENQARVDERIPLLLQTPAAVRFVSVEPMLGLVDLSCYLSWQYHVNLPEEERPRAMAEHWAGMHRLTKLDWVICGGETGPGARPMHPDWVRGLRDQCQAAGVPFHFKSWGEWAPNYAGCPSYALSQLVSDGNNGVLKMWRVGAKTSGRLLDGREWNEYPEVTANA